MDFAMTPRRLALIFLAACVIAPVSLFVHDFMLEWLHIPYPKTVGLPLSVTFIGLFVRLLSIALLCRIIATGRNIGRPISLAMVVALATLMLAETLRNTLVETAILSNFTYAALDNASSAIQRFLAFSLIGYVALRGTRWPYLVAIGGIIAAVLVFFVAPWLNPQFASWRDAVSGPVVEGYTDPYPFKINVVIYVTFIEPTIAAFMLAALSWPGFCSKHKIALFTVLLLFINGRVVGLALNSFWVRQSMPIAFLSESQFFSRDINVGLARRGRMVALGG